MGSFGWSLPPGCGTLPGEEPEDWGQDIEALLKELKGWDTGRWSWDEIDICLTGKDADLEPWGMQGFKVVSADDDGVTLACHGFKTVCGNDVCLNYPDGMSEEEQDKFRELYLDQAQEIVCGCGAAGEWDGDDWCLSVEETIKVPWVLTRKLGKPSYIRTARSCLKAVEKALSYWESEVTLCDAMLSQLSGWRDGKDKPCPEGKPDMEYSIFNPAYLGEPA